MSKINSSSTNPLLSIVVPTRNRAPYAIPAIRSLLSIPAKDVEFVVQDNSDNDELEQFLSRYNEDHRLSYSHLRARVDVNRNFERAFDRAKGEYLTLIGDDDAVNPEIVDATRTALNEGLEVLITSRPAQYWWPDVVFRYYGKRFAATLELADFNGGWRSISPRAELLKCVRAAGQDFFEMPRLYYGIVRRGALERVKKTAGTYFPGPSPDMAAAVAISSLVKRAALLDYPLFIPGTSGGSAAGLGARKAHIGRLEDQVHLSKTAIQNWSDLVPRFFSGNTMWGEAVVQSLKAIDHEEVLGCFNVARVHGVSLAFHPAYCRTIYRAFRKARQATESRSAGFMALFYWYMHAWYLRLRAKARRLLSIQLAGRPTLQVFRETEDVECAAAQLSAYLKTTGKTIMPPRLSCASGETSRWRGAKA